MENKQIAAMALHADRLRSSDPDQTALAPENIARLCA
jgi:hypothetical protein